jgi:2-oxoglutarate dehydrogenase complex dehydrogenase (E1) component-like enzyme
MCPWTFIAPRLAPLLLPSASLRYAGRPPSASPATGNATVHKTELPELLAAAFGEPSSPSPDGRGRG